MDVMDFEDTLKGLPFYDALTPEEKSELMEECEDAVFEARQMLHVSGEECSGLFLVKKGRIRAFNITPEGREVTLFRLEKGEMCMFSASCMMKNISFSISVMAETKVEAIRIPASYFSKLEQKNTQVALFSKDLLSRRMSDVMWVLEQILFQSFDQRLAAFLIEQLHFTESNVLTITHEEIANHMGSAREVVSRMLKYFEKEGMVALSRGKVTILDEERLEDLMA